LHQVDFLLLTWTGGNKLKHNRKISKDISFFASKVDNLFRVDSLTLNNYLFKTVIVSSKHIPHLQFANCKFKNVGLKKLNVGGVKTKLKEIKFASCIIEEDEFYDILSFLERLQTANDTKLKVYIDRVKSESTNELIDISEYKNIFILR
jgi:S-adenosylmethionine:diacylglycerol 3-amino-3-carboxypropyl transferase